MHPTIVLGGKRYEVRRTREGDLAPGSYFRDRFGRNVYRFLCMDGDDMILRNVRTPGLIYAQPVDSLFDEYLFVIRDINDE